MQKTIKDLKPGQIVVMEGFNVREDMGDLAQLAASIAANGVVEPIRVVKGDGKDDFKLINGHRRLEAAKIAIEEFGKKNLKIPAIVETSLKEDQMVLEQLTLNSGKELTILEQAEVYRRLNEEHGWDVDVLAEKSGKSTVHVANCLLLLSCNKSTLKLIREDRISASMVIELIREGEWDKKGLQDTLKEVADANPGLRITRKKLTGASKADKQKEQAAEKATKEATASGKSEKAAKETVKAAESNQKQQKVDLDVLKNLYGTLEKEAETVTLDGDKMDVLSAIIEFGDGLIDFENLVSRFELTEEQEEGE